MTDKKQNTTKETSNTPSNPNTSGLTPGEISWQKFQDMPYNNDMIGQAFITSSPMRPIATKEFNSGEKPETDQSI